MIFLYKYLSFAICILFVFTSCTYDSYNPNYFPFFEVGHEWKYANVNVLNNQIDTTNVVIYKIVKNIGNSKCKVAYTEIGLDTLIWYNNQKIWSMIKDYSGGKTTERLILIANIKVGDTFNDFSSKDSIYNIVTSVNEKVKVPAGEYICIKIKQYINSVPTNIIYHYYTYETGRIMTEGYAYLNNKLMYRQVLYSKNF